MLEKPDFKFGRRLERRCGNDLKDITPGRSELEHQGRAELEHHGHAEIGVSVV